MASESRRSPPPGEAFDEHVVAVVEAGLGAVTAQPQAGQIDTVHLLVADALGREVEREVGEVVDRRSVGLHRFEQRHGATDPVDRRQQSELRTDGERVQRDA